MITIRQCILALLLEHGPLTARELFEELDVKSTHVTGKLSAMADAGQAHISGWRRDEDGGRLYVRALWSAGPAPGPTPRKPKPLGDAGYNRRYRERRRVAVSSVWSLATPLHDRRLGGVTQ